MLCMKNRSNGESEGLGTEILNREMTMMILKQTLKTILSGIDIDCKDFNCTARSHPIPPNEVVEHLRPSTNPPDGLGPLPDSTANRPLVKEFYNLETQNLDV